MHSWRFSTMNWSTPVESLFGRTVLCNFPGSCSRRHANPRNFPSNIYSVRALSPEMETFHQNPWISTKSHISFGVDIWESLDISFESTFSQLWSLQKDNGKNWRKSMGRGQRFDFERKFRFATFGKNKKICVRFIAHLIHMHMNIFKIMKFWAKRINKYVYIRTRLDWLNYFHILIFTK